MKEQAHKFGSLKDNNNENFDEEFVDKEQQVNVNIYTTPGIKTKKKATKNVDGNYEAILHN